LATRLRPEEGLLPRDGSVSGRQELRAALEQRRVSWRQERRFRLYPAADLTQLEQGCIQPGVPRWKKMRCHGRATSLNLLGRVERLRPGRDEIHFGELANHGKRPGIGGDLATPE
jgi:hypothetical protein